MEEYKQGDFEKMGDATVQDDDEVKRSALVMIPKDNDFDPQFPAVLYRMGKYVTVQQGQRQQYLQFVSKSVYELCVREGRVDAVECYKQKCGILRSIIGVLGM